MSEVVRANKRVRGITLALVAGLAIASAVLQQTLWPAYVDYLRALAQTDPTRLREEYARAFFWMFGLIGVLGALLGLHLLRLGIRTRRADEFPPPGVKVIVDTRILRGARAQQMATGLMIGGGIFALAAVGLAFGFHATTREALAPLETPVAAPSSKRN